VINGPIQRDLLIMRDHSERRQAAGFRRQLAGGKVESEKWKV